MESKIDQQTLHKISELTQNVSAHKDATIARLLELVYDIKPELHYNYKAWLQRHLVSDLWSTKSKVYLSLNHVDAYIQGNGEKLKKNSMKCRHFSYVK